MDIENTTPELFAALSVAQGEIENASKNAANPHFRSKYADLAELLNTARPTLAKHGLSIIQAPSFDGSLCHVMTVITHASGGWVSSTASCIPAKADAQGIGSATTYLRRYGLAAMVGIAQEDDDGNAAAHDGKPRPVTARQYPPKDFNANLSSWRSAIEAGKHTADSIIAMVSTKGQLSPEQIKQIKACETEKAE